MLNIEKAKEVLRIRTEGTCLYPVLEELWLNYLKEKYDA